MKFKQELSYRKQIARQLHTQYVEGIYRPKYYSFQQAQVMPLLKKAGLDSSSPGNYRPISNLTTVSKVLERLVLTRPSARISELQRVPVRLQEGTLH